MTQFNELTGKVITKIHGLNRGSSSVIIECLSGEKYKMFHKQDCCESVEIEDVIGDVDDLLNNNICDSMNNPILFAEERQGDLPKMEDSEKSYTWTFYELATIQGSVTIRWYGSSNGFYSESVSFVIMK